MSSSLNAPRKNISKDPDRAVKYPGVKDDEVVLTCWSQVGDAGWCGTCLETASPGQPGYCGHKIRDPDPEEVLEEAEGDDSSEEEEDDSEDPRPTAWGGWGFCDSYCTPTNYQGFYWSNEPRLKEIRRLVKAHSDCGKHYNDTASEGSSFVARQSMAKLCIFQEREVEVGAEYRLIRLLKLLNA